MFFRFLVLSAILPSMAFASNCKIDQRDYNAAVLAIYKEINGRPMINQERVAQVIINRCSQNNKSIFQDVSSREFSFQGKHLLHGNLSKELKNPKYYEAHTALKNVIRTPVGGNYTYFFNPRYAPKSASRGLVCKSFANDPHVFCKKKGR